MGKRSSSVYVPVRNFFALTFFLSWLIWIPLALSHYDLGPFKVSEGLSSLIRLFGVLMPAVSAVILTAVKGGREGVGELLGRLGIWRVNLSWWLAGIVIYPVLLLASALIYNWVTGEAVPPAKIGSPAELAINIIFLAVAAIGEEIGWRGAALPALQRQFNPLRASLILGILWAAWHLPFWILLGNISEFGVGYIGLNFLFIVPMTFFMTWIFNHSRSSLLLPVAFHLVFNIINVAIIQVTSTVGAYAIFIVLQLLVVIAVSIRIKQPVLFADKA